MSLNNTFSDNVALTVLLPSDMAARKLSDQVACRLLDTCSWGKLKRSKAWFDNVWPGGVQGPKLFVFPGT